MAVPTILINSVSPDLVEKPISGNSFVDVNFEVVNEGIPVTSMTNTFGIGEFSVTDTQTATKRVSVPATGLGSWIWNTRFDFNVTDQSLRLIAFRIYIRNISWSPIIQLSLNLEPLHWPTTPTPTGWLEVVFPAPIALNLGMNSIDIRDMAGGDFQLFTTTVRPQVSGMSFTSTTLFRMEMDFTAAHVPVFNTSRILLDDSIPYGKHPLSFSSALTTQDGMVHVHEGVSDVAVRVTSLLPVRDSFVDVSSRFGTLTNQQPLIIGFRNVRNIAEEDVFVVSVLGKGGVVAYLGEVKLDSSFYDVLSLTIPSDVLEEMGVGLFDVNCFVRRYDLELVPYSFQYAIEDIRGNISVRSIAPLVVQKPFNRLNDPLVFDYVISGEVLSGFNVFRVGNHMTVRDEFDLMPREIFRIEPTTPNLLGFAGINMNFDVTDPEFRIIGFKFLFGPQTNGENTHNDLNIRIADTSSTLRVVDTVMFEDGIPPGWWEYVFDEPVHFTMGTGRGFGVLVADNSRNLLRVYNTNNIATSLQGATVTTASIRAMEITYATSANVPDSRERKLVLNLDGVAEVGEHPIVMESQITLSGSRNTHALEQPMGTFEVLENNGIVAGSLSISLPGRYSGAETDINLAVHGIMNVYAGDVMHVRLVQNATVYYEHGDLLSAGQESYGFTIPASAFVGLKPGRYKVEAGISRGKGNFLLETPYDVIERPRVYPRIVERFAKNPSMETFSGYAVLNNITISHDGFGLFGVRYFIEGQSGPFNLNLRVNGAVVHVSRFSSGVQTGWVDLVLDEPIGLPIGNHEIQLGSSTTINVYLSEEVPQLTGLRLNDGGDHAFGMSYMFEPNPYIFLRRLQIPCRLKLLGLCLRQARIG